MSFVSSVAKSINDVSNSNLSRKTSVGASTRSSLNSLHMPSSVHKHHQDSSANMGIPVALGNRRISKTGGIIAPSSAGDDGHSNSSTPTISRRPSHDSTSRNSPPSSRTTSPDKVTQHQNGKKEVFIKELESYKQAAEKAAWEARESADHALRRVDELVDKIAELVASGALISSSPGNINSSYLVSPQNIAHGAVSAILPKRMQNWYDIVGSKFWGVTAGVRNYWAKKAEWSLDLFRKQPVMRLGVYIFGVLASGPFSIFAAIIAIMTAAVFGLASMLITLLNLFTTSLLSAILATVLAASIATSTVIYAISRIVPGAGKHLAGAVASAEEKSIGWLNQISSRIKKSEM